MNSKIEPYDRDKLTCLWTKDDMEYFLKREEEGEYFRYYCIECKMRIKNETPLISHIMNGHNYSPKATSIIMTQIDELNTKVWKFRKIHLLGIEEDAGYEFYHKFKEYKKDNPPEFYHAV